MRRIKVVLDKGFNVLEERSDIEEYTYLAENTKQAVYSPKANYRFLIIEKEQKDPSYRTLADYVYISENPESDYWYKQYRESYTIILYTEDSISKAEKKINKEFQKWIDDKIAKYGVSTKVNIKLNSLEG